MNKKEHPRGCFESRDLIIHRIIPFYPYFNDLIFIKVFFWHQQKFKGSLSSVCAVCQEHSILIFLARNFTGTSRGVRPKSCYDFWFGLSTWVWQKLFREYSLNFFCVSWIQIIITTNIYIMYLNISIWCRTAPVGGCTDPFTWLGSSNSFKCLSCVCKILESVSILSTSFPNNHYCIVGLRAIVIRRLLNCIEPIWFLRSLKTLWTTVA